jgi:S1-C subfamily serine protease
MSERELNLIAARKYSQYSIFTRRKRKGGTRLLSAPNSRLKYLQQRIAELLAEIYKPRNSVHGFIRGKSALTNAKEHLGRGQIVKLDLKDFFGQINSRRVLGLLKAIGISGEVSLVIVRICLLADSLPQGAPSSPVLSNMISFRLDNSLLHYARENRLRYTRYADDIVFSSHGGSRALSSKPDRSYKKLAPEDLNPKLLQILCDEDFELNKEKIYFMGPAARRAVTGYIINEFPNVPRRHVRRVRATLHNIERNGYDREQINFANQTGSIKSLKRSLRGQIEWIGATKGLSDPVYRRYATDYNRIFGADMRIGPDLERMADLSTWVIESFNQSTGMPVSQGTVFFLQGIGLVTAAHCVPEGCDHFVFSTQNPGKRCPVSVESIDTHVDIALLGHTIPSGSFLELPRSNTTLHVGEEIQVWGFPAFGPGHKITKKIGRVTATPTIRAVPMYSVDVKIYGGNSGGPVLDKIGRVIGLCHKGGIEEAHDLVVQQSMLDHLRKSHSHF